MKYVFYTLALITAVGAVVAFFVTRGRRGEPSLDLSRRLEVIDAEVEARKLEVQLGHEEAVRRLEVQYAQELQVMDECMRVEADRLRGDPVALSRLLAEYSNGRWWTSAR